MDIDEVAVVHVGGGVFLGGHDDRAVCCAELQRPERQVVVKGVSYTREALPWIETESHAERVIPGIVGRN